MEDKTKYDTIKTISLDKDIDKTFNRLKQLQTLIKKESALRQICKI